MLMNKTIKQVEPYEIPSITSLSISVRTPIATSPDREQWEEETEDL